MTRPLSALDLAPLLAFWSPEPSIPCLEMEAPWNEKKSTLAFFLDFLEN